MAEPIPRRLAAILAADVVGYSRMMSVDEAGTLAALKGRRRDLLDPVIAKHGGRLFKLIGDGALVEFGSAVNAVQCAVALQEAFASANAALEDDKRIVLRIGVHLGDVMVEGSDLYGDGVNIAARLEGLAEPGGVLVSEDVHRQVANKLALAFSDIGPQQLKNIAQPVRAFRVSGTDVGASPVAPKAPERHEARASIAILPFANLSGDPEQIYFSDGITEDIISELSRFRELRVVARNSTFRFRDGKHDTQEVARKLGAQFIIEGSVRRSANRVRISVELIDCAAQTNIWSERYDREMIDVFQIQDEIAQIAATRVAGLTRTAVVERSRMRPTESLSAYDLFLRVRKMLTNYDHLPERQALLRRCLELDPDFSSAHALLAHTHMAIFVQTGEREQLESAVGSARRAIELDPEDPWANNELGLALTYHGSMGEAELYLRRAVELNHNEATFLVLLALWQSYAGREKDAIATIGEALRRDSYVVEWFWGIEGIIFAIQGRYVDALAALYKMASQTPLQQCYVAICYSKQGDTAQAKAVLKEYSMPGIRPSMLAQTLMPFANAGTKKDFIDTLRSIEAEGI